MNIIKYPRTPHLEGSKLQVGDEDLNIVKFSQVKNRYLVIEEKMDGANCGISFSEEGKVLFQSRGHFLEGGYGEGQFKLFKAWGNRYRSELYELLSKRYIMYGEWLYAKHTVFYDDLSHYFMEFDIFDKEKKVFLSTEKRRDLLERYKFINSVDVIKSGKFKRLEEISSLLTKSKFKTESFQENLRLQCEKLNLNYELTKKQTDKTNLMEGLYIKEENEDEVLKRFKYVRSSFLNNILDSETHWMKRPIVANMVKNFHNLFD